jgi:hypothetical protein
VQTAVERKQNTEKILSALGLPVPGDIPELEEEHAITLRTGQEVAERILILTYVNCAAIQPEIREGIMPFLQQEGLWEKVSLEEKEWFGKQELTEQDVAQMLWRSEAIWLLLWVINKVHQLHLPTMEVHLPDIFERIPPFFESTREFIASATLRNKSEILDQCDFIFRLVWIMKGCDASTINEMTLNENVAFERHFSINWVAGITKDWDR